jgi:hypothetical protein
MFEIGEMGLDESIPFKVGISLAMLNCTEGK